MRRFILPMVLLLCAAACKNVSVPVDTTGTAYIAPATVNLRGDIAQKNTVAVLKHGDRVRVLDQKRRFVQIRAGNGVTGWVDAFQLLTPEQMDALQKEREYASTLQSEGAAGVYDPLNIHLEPSRLSPSFTQIPEGGSVQVLQYRLVPRATDAVKPPVFNIDRPQPEHRKKRDAKQSFHLPKPAPPGLPPDYDAIAGIHAQVETPAAPPLPSEPVKPPVLEEWTLVRTKAKQTGWVLSRNLYMAIPDEVAQYAEGKRITSYFNLGEVKDEETGAVKHDWLWTTLSEPAGFDFDGWRVFIWSRRHHRFETSYRQRNVEGYFPVQVNGTEFKLIMKADDGKLQQRTYSFDGTLVRLTGAEAYQPNSTPGSIAAPNSAATRKQPGLLQRLLDKLRGKSGSSK